LPSDRHHLEEAGLDRALEVGMGLDPVDQPDPVGLGRGPIQPDRQPEGLADLDHVHRGPDLAAHGGLGDAVVGQDGSLALGGGSPMAPHGREHERSGALRLEPVHGGPDDDRDVGDSAAARADRDGIAALDGQVPSSQGPGHPGGDVFEAGAGEGLPDAVHRGQRDRPQRRHG
jgi:hypothetical protein